VQHVRRVSRVAGVDGRDQPAGDYIDHSASSVTGETRTTVRLHKENGFSSTMMSAVRSIERCPSTMPT